MSDTKMVKIMDMMKSRIRFYEDFSQHAYFFEEPEYSSESATKILKKLAQPNETKIEILEDLAALFE